MNTGDPDLDSNPTPEPEPLLGLATNEQMLRELICRFTMNTYVPGSPVTMHADIDRALLLAEMVGSMSAPEREYRTVDGG